MPKPPSRPWLPDWPRLDPVRREVSGPLGVVTLAPSELAIAWELATADGTVVTYDALSGALWGVPVDASTRAALRTLVHGLRARLRGAAAGLEVENRPGVGYRLAGRLAVRVPRASV